MLKLNNIDGSIEWLGGKRLKDLDYVVDICLFAKDIEEMKMMTEIVVAEASKVRLKINTRKTEIMRIHSYDN